MQISKNLLKWSRVFDIFKSPTNTLKIIKRKFIHKLYKKQQQKNKTNLNMSLVTISSSAEEYTVE